MHSKEPPQESLSWLCVSCFILHTAAVEAVAGACLFPCPVERDPGMS